MSKVARKPIQISEKVKLVIETNQVLVEGPLGKLEFSKNEGISVVQNDNSVSVETKNDELKALSGTTRALLSNMVHGVSVGWKKTLKLVGVGYRGALQGKKLTLNLGLSHSVEIEVPDYITIKMDGNTKFIISSPDKQKLGEFAAMVRSKRPPEPFKGKGIRYSNEFILRKEGKKK